MKGPNHVAVIDIGKTNVKLAVVDVTARREIGVQTRPNTVLQGPPYPHYDIEGHWDFILDSLKQLHRRHGIDAISVTTHGASLVLLDGDGGLAAPVLDYEFDGPDRLAPDYDAVRPPFAETGSPRLPLGLNAGAQLFWQLRTDPGLLARTATVLPYPQYWAFRLTGVLASEATSLGCHTDLWSPHEGRFSSLVEALGLAGKVAPVRRAAERLGPLRAEIAAATGLPCNCPVSCGIHDSNASLLPHLQARERPFSVVSTGTWVIALAVGGRAPALDPRRDTLINVDAYGAPVPSARFMGGREYDRILQGRTPDPDEKSRDRVVTDEILLLPAVDPRSGPFQGLCHRWTQPEASISDGARLVAVSFYLALVTSVCLEMTAADGPTLVEGPFAKNRHYLTMLATATGRPVEAGGGSVTGTSIGAALLAVASDDAASGGNSDTTSRIPPDPALDAYVAAWRAAVAAHAAVDNARL